MFNSIFDELIEGKYFTRNNRFQEFFKESFEESSSKSSVVFRTQVSIYDGAFLWIYLTANYFRSKNYIIDVILGYIKAFENIEIFKVKLRCEQVIAIVATHSVSCLSFIPSLKIESNAI